MSALDRRFLAAELVVLALIAVVWLIADQIGVPVRAFTPADESSPPVTTTLTITFRETMNRESVERGLRIRPSVDYRAEWEGNHFTLSFVQALEPGQRYNVSLYDATQTMPERRIQPVVWAFTPREPRFAYLAPASGEIRSLWIASYGDADPPTRLFAPENGILDYSPAPDGSQIAATVPRGDGGYDIWMVDVEAERASKVLDCAPASCSSPAFSPDGRQLAYEYREPDNTGEYSIGRIYLVDLAQGGKAPVYADESLVGFGPMWSPDGARLGFIDSTRGAIRVVDLASHDAALLPSQMGQVGAFAPDGSQMIYNELVRAGGQFITQLFYVDLDGDQGVVPLLDDAEEDRGPAWSPLGQRLVFGRRVIDRSAGAGFQMMQLDLESGEITALTDDPVYNNLAFAWDPTGRLILFTRFELGAEGASPGIWLYDTDDGSIRPLVEDALDGHWLP